MAEGTSTKKTIAAVDLFCGAGGLTQGLEKAGIDVRLGVDIDPACAYPYAVNNEARFELESVNLVSAREVQDAMNGAPYRLLAGCAPCQPFSTYSQGKTYASDDRWHLLRQLARLVRETRPHLVMTENVPRLAQQDIFDEFVAELCRLKFHVSYRAVQCADYGVPQRRQRLVLLASRLGPIEMIPPTHTPTRYVTVRQAIGALPPIEAGEAHARDPLHAASKLSKLNLARLRASRPGGTWRDWPKSLIAECHQRDTGRRYPGVYGRMVWDEPAPTMTTQFYGFGNGRFGHPEQDRAISLREGAILQGFPEDYSFVPNGAPIQFRALGRMIGNAVPVKLGEVIGKSVLRHVGECG